MNQTQRRNHYDQGAAFVAPTRRPPPPPIDIVSAHPIMPAAVEAVWQAKDGAEERTSATDRAKAVVIRSLPILALVALLALAGAIVVGMLAGTVGGVLAFLVAMACIGAWVYRQESRTEYQHSRAGLEIYRIDAAVEIKLAELEHTAELRKQALTTYLRMLEDKDHER